MLKIISTPRNGYQLNPYRRYASTSGRRSGTIKPWLKAVLILGVQIMFPGRPVWASTGGFVVSASAGEISGGIFLVGLCLAALIFGFRLVLHSVMAGPVR